MTTLEDEVQLDGHGMLIITEDGDEVIVNRVTDEDESDELFGAISCESDTVDATCESDTVDATCESDTVGATCESDTVGATCESDTVGATCESDTVGATCKSDTVDATCESDTVDATSLEAENRADISYNVPEPGPSSKPDCKDTLASTRVLKGAVAIEDLPTAKGVGSEMKMTEFVKFLTNMLSLNFHFEEKDLTNLCNEELEEQLSDVEFQLELVDNATAMFNKIPDCTGDMQQGFVDDTEQDMNESVSAESSENLDRFMSSKRLRSSLTNDAYLPVKKKSRQDKGKKRKNQAKSCSDHQAKGEAKQNMCVLCGKFYKDKEMSLEDLLNHFIIEHKVVSKDFVQNLLFVSEMCAYNQSDRIYSCNFSSCARKHFNNKRHFFLHVMQCHVFSKTPCVSPNKESKENENMIEDQTPDGSSTQFTCNACFTKVENENDGIEHFARYHTLPSEVHTSDKSKTNVTYLCIRALLSKK